MIISSRLLSVHLSLGRPLLLFPGTTTSIIFLDKLSSSLLLTREEDIVVCMLKMCGECEVARGVGVGGNVDYCAVVSHERYNGDIWW